MVLTSTLSMLIGVVAAAVFGLNVAATLAVLRREGDLRLRRRQLALVWLVPGLGSALALVVHAPELPHPGGASLSAELDGAGGHGDATGFGPSSDFHGGDGGGDGDGGGG